MKYIWTALAALALAGATVCGPALAGTVISGSSNGIGNSVGVSGSGLTVIQGSRLGIGNTIQVDNGGASVRIDDNGVSVVSPAKRFWSKCVWSEKYGCTLYWSPRAKGWYRFDSEDRAYYPLEVYPDTK